MKVEFQNITKRFNSDSDEEVKALDGLSLSIPSRQFLVVIGANGSGKSTLLNILSGSVASGSGKLLIEDRDVTGSKEYELSRVVARVFQNPQSGTAAGLTVLENLRLASLRSKPKLFKTGLDQRFKALAREKLSGLGLGLENKLNQEAGTLSGGQRQALSLVMATMDQPGILLLDEPSAALDPRSSLVIMQLAEKIVKEFKLTAILVTHNMKDAIRYGDRLICMKEGKITKDIQPSEEKMKLEPATLYTWFDT
jgi:putative tryptophan/tyrosine transport system ATP-binding protein